MTAPARALAVAAWLALSACAPDAPRDRVELAPCRLQGLERELRCGSREVWEDRESGQGRRITLQVAVIPARSRKAQPDPVVVLAGGPGQGAIGMAAQMASLFSKLNDSRDIVLIDQRGTGGSHPLHCDSEAGASLQAMFEDMLQEKIVADCLASLEADPRQYGTSAAVADLDEVLGAMGYAKVNLWGGSYGTRVALQFMRRFPGRVRSATLDGVAPAGMKLPLSFVTDGEAAFDKLAAACEAEAACREAYPELLRRVSALRAKLARKPAQVLISDPLTGESHDIGVTETIFLSGLFRPLYAPVLASLLPLAIARADEGNFNTLLAQNLELAERVNENLAIGMHLSVLCAEDVALITPDELTAASRRFFGRALVEDFLRACRLWPRAAVPADYYEPVRVSAPVLLLSGGLDPATPPRHAEAVAAMLPNARHLVAPNLAHGVSGQGCAPRLIEQFVRQADAKGLDATCLARIPRPLFALPIGAMP